MLMLIPELQKLQNCIVTHAFPITTTLSFCSINTLDNLLKISRPSKDHHTRLKMHQSCYTHLYKPRTSSRTSVFLKKDPSFSLSPFQYQA